MFTCLNREVLQLSFNCIKVLIIRSNTSYRQNFPFPCKYELNINVAWAPLRIYCKIYSEYEPINYRTWRRHIRIHRHRVKQPSVKCQRFKRHWVKRPRVKRQTVKTQQRLKRHYRVKKCDNFSFRLFSVNFKLFYVH